MRPARVLLPGGFLPLILDSSLGYSRVDHRMGIMNKIELAMPLSSQLAGGNLLALVRGPVSRLPSVKRLKSIEWWPNSHTNGL